ncbi:hypothetical protein CesoFtcFv8_003221 [Champsocephalus esox]|uniref:Condensin complex subunit 1 C-terminal domain-containing protein n=2 Tax=Champsocephalus TaxID=52236 RepID=A0AAN8DZ50_CHAGU|nr:hypothetical protein CesoFtcFv8_003221 [Champsocephalus esox]KAK5931902.1 hypothetical protein CgunFtcFv8_003655 [Champsocephalus gunnari]
MAGSPYDPSRAPVAYGRRAVPQLFSELQQQEAPRRVRALASLCDLLRDPERISCTVSGGFLEQLKVLLKDEDSIVRAKTCELLHLLTAHRIGRQALLSSSFLPHLSELMDDSSSSCRRNVQRVLNRLTLMPAGAEALLTLVPKLMLKLREEEEDVQVLLLSTLSSCSCLDPLPALASDGVSLLLHKLSDSSTDIRREAAAALMALSVCEDGMRQVCEKEVLPVLVNLLRDEDVEVQANAAGVIMYAAITNEGKQQCLDLDVIPILLSLVSQDGEEEKDKERKKALVMYSLRALTALAEAPQGRCLLLEQLPLLGRRSEAAEEDQDIRRNAQNAVRVITWTPCNTGDL